MSHPATLPGGFELLLPIESEAGWASRLVLDVLRREILLPLPKIEFCIVQSVAQSLYRPSYTFYN
jgi:hypothetical protein